MTAVVVATPPPLSWSSTDLNDLDLDELLEVFEETFENWHRSLAKLRESRVAGNLADERGVIVSGRPERVAGTHSTGTLPLAGAASRAAADKHTLASSRSPENTHRSSTLPRRDANLNAPTASQADDSDASFLSDIDLDPAIEAFLGPRRPSRSTSHTPPRASIPIPVHFAALDDFFVTPRTSYFPDVPHQGAPTPAVPAGLPRPGPSTELLEPLSPLPPRPARASTIRQGGPNGRGLGSAKDHDAVSFISNSSSNRTIKTTTSGSGSTGSQSYAPLAMYPRPPPSKSSKSAIYPEQQPPPDVEEKRAQIPLPGKTSLSLRWRKVER